MSEREASEIGVRSMREAECCIGTAQGEAFATDFTLKAKMGVFSVKRQTISVCERGGNRFGLPV